MLIDQIGLTLEILMLTQIQNGTDLIP